MQILLLSSKSLISSATTSVIRFLLSSLSKQNCLLPFSSSFSMPQQFEISSHKQGLNYLPDLCYSVCKYVAYPLIHMSVSFTVKSFPLTEILSNFFVFASKTSSFVERGFPFLAAKNREKKLTTTSAGTITECIIFHTTATSLWQYYLREMVRLVSFQFSWFRL